MIINWTNIRVLNLATSKESFIPRCATPNRFIVFTLQSKAAEIVVAMNRKHGLIHNKQRFAQQMSRAQYQVIRPLLRESNH